MFTDEGKEGQPSDYVTNQESKGSRNVRMPDITGIMSRVHILRNKSQTNLSRAEAPLLEHWGVGLEKREDQRIREPRQQ